MPKTKDAFAFRDFDDKRILSRPFFKAWRKEFHFAVGGYDTDMLDAAFGEMTAKNLPVAELEQLLIEMNFLQAEVIKHHKLIKNHIKTLRELSNHYAQRFTATSDERYRSKHERAAGLWREYNWIEEATDMLALRFGGFQIPADKAIQQKYREAFANGLKKARLKEGITQRELAMRLRIAPPNISQYENATIEPTLKNLNRLANILRTSTDALLGRHC